MALLDQASISSGSHKLANSFISCFAGRPHLPCFYLEWLLSYLSGIISADDNDNAWLHWGFQKQAISLTETESSSDLFNDQESLMAGSRHSGCANISCSGKTSRYTRNIMYEVLQHIPFFLFQIPVELFG